MINRNGEPVVVAQAPYVAPFTPLVERILALALPAVVVIVLGRRT